MMSDDDETAREEEEQLERVASIELNCGSTPKLNDLELNIISDEINYICDDLLFVEAMKDKNRKFRMVLDNDIEFIRKYKAGEEGFRLKDNMQRARFRDIGVPIRGNHNTILGKVVNKMDEFLLPDDPRPVIWNSVHEFEESLDRLVDKLSNINGKTESMDKFAKRGQRMVLVYVIYIVGMFYMYLATLVGFSYLFMFGGEYEGEQGALAAERYNIGFVSQVTYLSMVHRSLGNYGKFCKIVYTDGDLDAGVCRDLSGIVKNVKIFYEALLCTKKGTSNCKPAMLNSLYSIYEDKYVKNIFMAAKSEYKEAVNSITKFVDKQKKFMLREDNFDINYTTDNEVFENLYRVLLHNGGVELFRDDRNAHSRRLDVKGRDYDSYSAPVAKLSSYEEFLKNDLIKTFIKIMANPESFDGEQATGTQTNTQHLRRIVLILTEIKKEHLPEFEELVDIFFAVDTAPYFNYSKIKYVSEAFLNIRNLSYTSKHGDYFVEAREKLKINGHLVMEDDAIDEDVTTTTLLTKVQSRKKNMLTLHKSYEDLQNAIRSGTLSPQDIDSEGDFGEVYTILKEHFNSETEEYKVTKQIVMGFLTAYLKSDEEFATDPALRQTVLLNIGFLIGSMVNQLKLSRDIRQSVLDEAIPNSKKYLSFLKFENKLNQLDNNDIRRLFSYFKEINTTMRNFRKYVKSEEMTFSKKYQIAEVYKKFAQDMKWHSFVIMMVTVFNMFKFSKDPYKQFDYIITEGSKKLKDKAGELKDKASKMVKGAGASESKDENKDQKKDQKKEEEEFPGVMEQLTDLILPVTAAVVTWYIIFEFVDSFLTKYMTDINYDKVTTITNTEIFERNLDKLERYFLTYIRQRRATGSCKTVYNQLIKTLESYEQCNFIKSSYKMTPFPVSEMMTNGLVLVMCIGVIYVAYTGTGMNVRKKNARLLEDVMLDAMKDPMGELTKTDAPDLTSIADEIKEFDDSALVQTKNTYLSKRNAERERLDKIYGRVYRLDDVEKWKPEEEKKFKEKLRDFLKKYDKSLAVVKSIKTLDVNEESPNEFVSNTGKSEKRKQIFIAVLDAFRPPRIEGTGENQPGGAGNQVGGDNNAPAPSANSVSPPPVAAAPMGMGMGSVTELASLMGNDVDLSTQNELLERYSRKNDRIKAQLIMMQRDTGYVNFVVAGCVVSFGLYFVDMLQTNTKKYKEVMNSGGTYTRECL